MDVSAVVPLPAEAAQNTAGLFADLAGVSPLVRVVRSLLGDDPTQPIVAAAVPLVDQTREHLAAHGLSSVPVVAPTASDSRAGCIASALEYTVQQRVSIRYLLIYDHRRPLTSAAVRQRVVVALRAGSTVVMPALALTDSVKAVDDRGVITGTVDRSTLWTVQYPRGFTIDALMRMMSTAADDFDEMAESERAGLTLTLVDGDPDGLAVELPDDAPFVEALIACRPGGR